MKCLECGRNAGTTNDCTSCQAYRLLSLYQNQSGENEKTDKESEKKEEKKKKK